jgi:hypothetical protein
MESELWQRKTIGLEAAIGTAPGAPIGQVNVKFLELHFAYTTLACEP